MGGKDLLPGVLCLQGPRTCQNAGCLAFCHDRASGVRAEQLCPPESSTEDAPAKLVVSAALKSRAFPVTSFF